MDAGATDVATDSREVGSIVGQVVGSVRCSGPRPTRERIGGRHPSGSALADTDRVGPPTGFSTLEPHGRAVHRSGSWIGSMEGSGYEGRPPSAMRSQTWTGTSNPAMCW